MPVASERRLVADEVLVELSAGASLEAVARRHRVTLLRSERFALANVTLVRFKVQDARTARATLAEMAGDPRIAAAQPNYVYTLQQAGAPVAVDPGMKPPELPKAVADPAPAPERELKPQYVLQRIGADQAHKSGKGNRVRVVVIDSGADANHPELRGVIAGQYDALEEAAALPHNHGTAMAGAIVAQSSLRGVAPSAELLTARAFSGKVGDVAANGTTWHVLKSLDWAAAQSARVINLSFAGPEDRLLSRALEAARGKGMIAVAAAGNGGPNAAALYPGADPNVIAVTATDADDKAFSSANRGGYVQIAAPGVDILVASAGERYEFSTGTSIATAHVSGVIALILERNPALDLAAIRKVLSETALDLGAKGRDPIFGAGRIDAAAAVARAGAMAPAAGKPR